jgi:hypothetical protein
MIGFVVGRIVALCPALFGAVPALMVVGLVFLLNDLNVSAGIAVAAFGVLAVATGVALGYFADRLPELPSVRRHPPAD